MLALLSVYTIADTIARAAWEAARHPVVVVVVGFILTNVRSFIEHQINRREAREARTEASKANAKLDDVHKKLNGGLHDTIREVVREEMGKE